MTTWNLNKLVKYKNSDICQKFQREIVSTSRKFWETLRIRSLRGGKTIFFFHSQIKSYYNSINCTPKSIIEMSKYNTLVVNIYFFLQVFVPSTCLIWNVSIGLKSLMSTSHYTAKDTYSKVVTMNEVFLTCQLIAVGIKTEKKWRFQFRLWFQDSISGLQFW